MGARVRDGEGIRRHGAGRAEYSSIFHEVEDGAFQLIDSDEQESRQVRAEGGDGQEVGDILRAYQNT